jgi:predicted ATP-grasp superfamily ATP-dependent carboligase
MQRDLNTDYSALPPVVVMNVHHSGLGIARSLGPLGIAIYGVGAYDSPGNYSKFIDYRRSPDSLLQPVELTQFLIELSRSIGTKAIILPTRDHDIAYLLKHRSTLEEHFIVPLAEGSIIEHAMNKDMCFDVARSCGLALPTSRTIANAAELESAVRQIGFPAILKPLYARQWRRPVIRDLVGKQKALLFESSEDLIAAYERIREHEPVATIQQYIPGPEENLVVFGSYCSSAGAVRAYFTGRKILQLPPLRGTGVVLEGCPVPEIVEPSKALLRALGFTGISEIEFKIHETTKVPYLIEINPRHWDQHHLGTACGVNLSLELYRDVTGHRLAGIVEPTPAGPAQTGYPIRWIAEEELLFHLLPNVVRGYVSIREAFGMLRGPRIFAVWDGRDRGPGWRQMRVVARRLLRIA